MTDVPPEADSILCLHAAIMGYLLLAIMNNGDDYGMEDRENQLCMEDDIL